MRNVLVFDPGDHTGWVYRSVNGSLEGGTVLNNMEMVTDLIDVYNPDIVVIETFHLYPGAAKHLTYNAFYPCQVIGAIKLKCLTQATQCVTHLVEQSPSVKRYSGGLDDRWKEFRQWLIETYTGENPIDEHVKDAYLHLKYFENNIEPKEKVLGKWLLPETL